MNKCSSCNTDFGSLALFEEHRKGWRIASDQQLKGKCATPESMGLAQDGKGTWHHQSVLEKIAKMRAAKK